MASPKLIVDAIKRRCTDVEPRFEDYEKELFTAVVDILTLEREHRISPTNIQKKAQDKVDVLGDQIWHLSDQNA